jgi:SAM-dependent methyltransferase
VTTPGPAADGPSISLRLSRGDALPYYRRTASPEYWSKQWHDETFEHLLAVARVSELTRFLERHVLPGARVLEAGCGLGQYVRLFADRGAIVTGVDFSASAIARHHDQFPDSNVLCADLTALPFADGSFDVYISLGVVEHDPGGGAKILAEARRVLAPDGTLLLSTPYLNAIRRALRRRIVEQQCAAVAAGAEFYQYAFDESALAELLARAGFIVGEQWYYDPGRGLRDLRALAHRSPAAAPASSPSSRAPRPHRPLRKAILYARPTLKLLAHMQIVAARPVPVT